MLKYHRLIGKEARRYSSELAALRLKVFWDFPYLYEGSLEYEMKYLETYFQANHAFIFLVEDEGKIVGATTSIHAIEEEENFRKPFSDFGLNPETVFYFGESVLLPDYRGRGIGKKFFEERESYAKTLCDIQYLSFCAVERPENHVLRPQNYEPLDAFWKTQGFTKAEGLKTQYEWKDRNEDQSTLKTMQFWLKQLRR